MWRNHIQKLNITFPSEVLVLSDERSYRNLTFHNVSARLGSFYCNRARLNFQAFCVAWHENCDPRRLSCRSKDELSLLLVFANWRVLALEETFLSMCWSSRAIILRFSSKTQWQMFLLLYGRPSEGHKHGVSIQSSINLGHTLLQITCGWKTAETWLLARLFIYQSSIVSQSLDFFHRMVMIFSFDHMTGEIREFSIRG